MEDKRWRWSRPQAEGSPRACARAHVAVAEEDEEVDRVAYFAR